MILNKSHTLYSTDDFEIIFLPFGLNKVLAAGIAFAIYQSIPFLIIGFALGLLFDLRVMRYYRPSRPADIGLIFLMLAAAVMKVNGLSNQREMTYTYTYLNRHFGPDYVEVHKPLLHGISQQVIPVDGLCEQLTFYESYQTRLRLLYFLFGITSADGIFKKQEDELIQHISDELKITHHDYRSIRAMYYKVKENAYQTLGIDMAASDQEIRWAYHSMAKKYHPDRMAGADANDQETAKVHFQRITGAYQQIKRQRGIA